MDILYAPWRDKYVKHSIKHKNDDHEACTFCTIFSVENDDDKHFILKKTKHAIVILNLYPYNSGHVLILPRLHSADLENLSKAARAEIMELINASIIILKKELQAQGINSGINLGTISGAGMPTHLHFHVVPRWIGDTSFITVIGDTKSISVDLKRIYNELKPAFQALEL